MSAQPQLDLPRLAPVDDLASPVLVPHGSRRWRPGNEPSGRPIAQRREAIFRRALVLSDAFAMAVSMVVAVMVFGGDLLRPWAALAPLVLVIGAKIFGLYDRDELVLRRSTLDELPQLAQLAALAVFGTWIGEAVFVDGSLGRSDVITFLLLLASGLAGGRWTARRMACRFSPAESCIVVGDRSQYDRLHAKLEDRRKVTLSGVVPLDVAIDDLPALVAMADEACVQRLIIAPPGVGMHEDTMNLIRAAKMTGLRVSIVPGVLEVVGSAVAFDELGGLTLLGTKRFGLSRSSAALKRGFDICGAMAALLLFGPLMLVLAVAIRWDTPGPVFFRQVRVGRDGRRFRMVKFRTMVDGADALRGQLASLNEASGGLFKIRHDPRITRVGRLLRRASLDELPQLLNVLRGEMSLVGPRPLVVSEDERITGFGRHRLMLTPGMTGHWQIAGSARVPLPEMMKIDYLYVATWSLWADIKILLNTVPYMLARRGQ
jgi:exopolysaccharide biosynthesis polyprenyl glycosylphosphotransferase